MDYKDQNALLPKNPVETRLLVCESFLAVERRFPQL